MKSWILFAKLFSMALLCTSQVLAQNDKWQASLHVGAAWSVFNGGFSYYNQYERYGKVPYDLKGYEPYLKYVIPETWPASGFGVQYQGSIRYLVTPRFKVGLASLIQPTKVDGSNAYTGYTDGYSRTDGMENSFSRTVVLVNGAFLFKQRPKSHWEVSAALGGSYMVLREMVFLESELPPQNAFNGTAYDYLERNDWAFTWGIGLAYQYNFAPNWGLIAGFDFTTFNLKPESATRYSYKIDGVELVETLTIREQQFIFTDQYADRPDEPNAPQVLPAENYRYFVPQFTIGVGYSF